MDLSLAEKGKYVIHIGWLPQRFLLLAPSATHLVATHAVMMYCLLLEMPGIQSRAIHSVVEVDLFRADS